LSGYAGGGATAREEDMEYQDIVYAEKDGVATIRINRPRVYNAFRPKTVVEMIDAFLTAGWRKEIGAIVLTGTGDKAFCTGGDRWRSCTA
jgi:2-ketocyclohexanecarboxyl-CoA hydrolase